MTEICPIKRPCRAPGKPVGKHPLCPARCHAQRRRHALPPAPWPAASVGSVASGRHVLRRCGAPVSAPASTMAARHRSVVICDRPVQASAASAPGAVLEVSQVRLRSSGVAAARHAGAKHQDRLRPSPRRFHDHGATGPNRSVKIALRLVHPVCPCPMHRLPWHRGSPVKSRRPKLAAPLPLRSPAALHRPVLARLQGTHPPRDLTLRHCSRSWLSTGRSEHRADACRHSRASSPARYRDPAMAHARQRAR